MEVLVSEKVNASQEKNKGACWPCTASSFFWSSVRSQLLLTGGNRMALIQWNDSLNVGVSEIDKQHQKLVEMINDLNFLNTWLQNHLMITTTKPARRNFQQAIFVFKIALLDRICLIWS
jgi:hypothetical protein